MNDNELELTIERGFDDVLIEGPREELPDELYIDDEEIEVLTEKHVCVFWSNKGADRVSVGSSTQNKFDKNSDYYDSCSVPDMQSDAALPPCSYDIVEQGDAEIYCPFYEAEHEFILFETDKGKVTTTRLLEFENMEMTREFKVIMEDGSETIIDNSVRAFEMIRD